MQIDLLVLDALPEPFDEDVIAPAAFAVHADLNAVLSEQADEVTAGEWAALICIKNLGGAMRIPTKSATESGLNRPGNPR